MKELFAEIVFPLPIDHPFTYRIPESLIKDIEVGSRVLVPFGKRRLTGFVVGIKDKCDLSDIKDLEDLLDPKPVFSSEMLQLTRWIADYYLCSWGEALGAALPAGTKLKSKGIARLKGPHPEEIIPDLEKKAPKQAQIIKTLSRSGELSFDGLRRKLKASNFYFNLYSLQKKGYVEIDYILPGSEAKVKFEKVVRINKNFKSLTAEIESLKNRAPKQARCLELLASEAEGLGQTELLRIVGVNSTSLRRLQEKGLVEIFQRETIRDYYEGLPGQGVYFKAPPPITLNKDQTRALEAIKNSIAKGQFCSFLLHGVTGSGKTQIYIEAIAEILKRGKTAIVLVPEISLTPQMVGRFRSYFSALADLRQDQVAVFHSRMSVGERYDSWRKTQEGAFRIVIGPRSAIFAPLRDIGLIVVDEEQEATYKQFDPSPRYNARDVAVMRAKLNNAVVVLGSATPSMESYYNALKGKYRLLVLPTRVDNIPLPQVEIINMAKEWKLMGSKKAVVFSRRLLAKMEEKFNRGEQVILLQNRRGFSSFIICRECGHIERCPNCNITLTYHLKNFLLRCHYCNLKKHAPEVCPHCGGTDIKYSGIGTQRVEEELKKHFPKVKLIRMDLDTTSRKGAHDRIFRDFDDGRYDVLLGTQMVAKGLDFPRVTLVGVISADTSLLLPDFRACERTFQLLTQVAGRAGRRDKMGEVVIQTYSADNPGLLYARKHDFLRFYRSEIKDRQELLYPPFGRLVSISFRGREENQVEKAAKNFIDLLDKESHFFQVLGPAPCPLAKIKKEYRWQIILKGDKRVDPAGKELRAEVKKAKETYENKFHLAGVKVTIDVDPLGML